MATRAANAVLGQNREVTVTWEGLVGDADVGAAVAFPHLPIKTVQVLGTFGGGAPGVTMEGSNDGGTTWATLHADDGGTLVFTAAGMEAIVENPGLIRPDGHTGTGGDIDVIVVCVGDR